MAESSSTDFSIFTTVFYYSISILLLPITAFFVLKIIFFDGIIGASSTTSNVWSAVIAVVILHIALGMFIFRAYSVDKGRPERKDDKID